MISVFGRQVPHGERATFWTKVGELNDGRSLEIPVIVINGAEDGARACLAGAVHGDEYNGPAAISRLCTMVDPRKLRGSIVGLPIVNPPAFYTVSRMVTLDYEHFNLNRVWPGDPRGFLSQRLAHTIFQECVLPATFVIDNHEGGRDLLARYLLVGGTEQARAKTHDRPMHMARVFGHGIPIYDRVIQEEVAIGRASSLTEAAAQVGIPSLVPELGGGAMIHEEYVQIAVQGMLNVLRQMKMLDGDLISQDAEPLVVLSGEWMRADCGGFLSLHREIGEKVSSGERLFTVLDPFGNVRQEVAAPFNSVILDVRLRASTLPGEWVYHCGRLHA